MASVEWDGSFKVKDRFKIQYGELGRIDICPVSAVESRPVIRKNDFLAQTHTEHP